MDFFFSRLSLTYPNLKSRIRPCFHLKIIADWQITCKGAWVDQVDGAIFAARQYRYRRVSLKIKMQELQMIYDNMNSRKAFEGSHGWHQKAITIRDAGVLPSYSWIYPNSQVVNICGTCVCFIWLTTQKKIEMFQFWISGFKFQL